MSTIKHRIDSVVHFLLGSTLLLKGYDKFHHHNILGALMFLFGIIVMGYFFYLVLKQQHNRTMHIMILLFEALVSLFIAYIFIEEGKKYVQYGFILAAIGFLLAAYITFSKKKHA